MKTSGIYEIVNTTNGKRYIGSAVRLDRRWSLHGTELRAGTHHNEHLQNSWNKHGADAFQFRALLICNRRDLLFYEQRCLDQFKPEYNICATAGSALGVKRTAATRAKFLGNKYSSGRKLSIEHRAAILAEITGRRHSPESRALMSEAKKGHMVSDETRAKIAAALTGRKNPLISALQTGKRRGPPSTETRAKMSAAYWARHQ